MTKSGCDNTGWAAQLQVKLLMNEHTLKQGQRSKGTRYNVEVEVHVRQAMGLSANAGLSGGGGGGTGRRGHSKGTVS